MVYEFLQMPGLVEWKLDDNNDHEQFMFMNSFVYSNRNKTMNRYDKTNMIEMRGIYFHQRTFNICTFYCNVLTLLKWNFIIPDYGITSGVLPVLSDAFDFLTNKSATVN